MSKKKQNVPPPPPLPSVPLTVQFAMDKRTKVY